MLFPSRIFPLHKPILRTRSSTWMALLRWLLSPLRVIYHTLAMHIGEGNGNPLQYSCLENPMGGGAWWAVVHGVAKSRTRLRDFTFTFHVHALEKEMATRSSVLAWRIPGTVEPGGLLSMGSHRVGHYWSDLAAPAAAMHIKICFILLRRPKHKCKWSALCTKEA